MVSEGRVWVGASHSHRKSAISGIDVMKTLFFILTWYTFSTILTLQVCPILNQGVSKGLVAEKIFTSMAESGRQADFVLCIGDDRSDEDMFEIIGNAMNSGVLSSNTSVFACTVGQKPSKAKYYLDDPNEVITMLEALAEESGPPPSTEVGTQGTP